MKRLERSRGIPRIIKQKHHQGQGKKKTQQNEEKFKGLGIFKNLKIKADEKCEAKPLTFLQL